MKKLQNFQHLTLSQQEKKSILGGTTYTRYTCKSANSRLKPFGIIASSEENLAKQIDHLNENGADITYCSVVSSSNSLVGLDSPG
ncbi:hypothetical protein BKI52_23950 [marine bacterium AO1-C]|nr:hypothetical protein BKI52_23950 [marine bacterium AO1-C]